MRPDCKILLPNISAHCFQQIWCTQSKSYPCKNSAFHSYHLDFHIHTDHINFTSTWQCLWVAVIYKEENVIFTDDWAFQPLDWETKMELPCKQNETRINFMFPEPHLWSLKVFSFSTQTDMYRQEEEFIFTVCLQSAPVKIVLNTPMNSTSDTVGTPSARDRCKADSFLNVLGKFSEETMGCERRKDHSLI